MMVWIDYIIIAIIGYSSLVSLIRGFIQEALSLINWVFIFFTASQFYFCLAIYLTRLDNQLIKNSIGTIILLVITLIIDVIVNHTINLLVVERTRLLGSNCMLGICFGVLRGILIVSMILIFLDIFTPLPNSEGWQHSKLIPQFSYIIRWFFDYLKNISSFLLEEISQLN